MKFAESALASYLQRGTTANGVHSPAGEVGSRAGDAGRSDDSNNLFRQRIRCPGCHVSRSLYCPECLVLHIQDESYWPEPVLNGSLHLPFALDLVLDDRRTSSTGIHLAILLHEARRRRKAAIHDGNDSDSQKRLLHNQLVRIFDLELNDSIPDYDDEAGDKDDNGSGKTYLLFPGENSRPVSSVFEHGDAIKRLVVLDCKWRRSSIRLHPSIAKLPRLHLDNPPKESFYWRWHNSGEGMLSTIEAVYYAAWQVYLSDAERASAAQGPCDECRQRADVDRDSHSDQMQSSTEDQLQLLDLFWLFALQREIIHQSYSSKNNTQQHKATRNNHHATAPSPFSKDGKEYHRSLRQKHPNYKQRQPRPRKSKTETEGGNDAK